jgi:hypothetical protein
MNTIWRNSYFGKLFRKEKSLFVLILLFGFFSLLANLIRLETSPFFVWNMYAERYYPKQDYEVTEIRYHGKPLNFRHTWMSPQQVFLTEPLYNFLHARKLGGVDPARDYLEHHWAVKHPAFKNMVEHLVNQSRDYDLFPAWYRDYLYSIRKEPLDPILVLNKKLRFLPDGKVNCLAEDTLLLIP